MNGGKRSTAYNRDMAREQDNTKRWRPRWSIRILLIIITLICAYLACWGPTKNQGVADVVREKVSGPQIEAVAPFIVRAETWNLTGPDKVTRSYRRYYFWFFGYVAKLPYERELPEREPMDILPTDPH